MIAGTSTGGIISLGLTVPDSHLGLKYSAKEIAQFYVNEGTTIFTTSLWQELITVKGLLDERQSSRGIETVLAQFFRETKLVEALTDVVITAYEIEKRKAWFFKSQQAKNPSSQKVYKEVRMRDVARATSAAPTYFEPHYLEMSGNHFALVDRGVFANKYAMCAYIEAKTMYPKEKEFLLVSLDTGSSTRPLWFKDSKDWGLAEWAQPILDVVFDGVSDTIDYQLKQLLPLKKGQERYYRFQTELTHASDSLADASDMNIYALQTTAWNLAEENVRKIATLCEQLLRP